MSFGNKGYVGWSMSENAANAYATGEKPLSKWTKDEVLSAVEDIAPEKVDLVKKLPMTVIKSKLLSYSSWHHTAKFYNQTDFYSVDEDAVADLDAETVEKWLREHEEDKKQSKAQATEAPTKRKGAIDYIVWSGTRNHPKANKERLEHVFIEEKGCFYIVTDEKGSELLRKKKGSNGTSVTYDK